MWTFQWKAELFALSRHLLYHRVGARTGSKDVAGLALPIDTRGSSRSSGSTELLHDEAPTRWHGSGLPGESLYLLIFTVRIGAVDRCTSVESVGMKVAMTVAMPFDTG